MTLRLNRAADRRLLTRSSQDRFVGSLTSLRDKNQRTVYRLTLVKGMNAADAGEYAKLIDLGKPDFIEIKGMTYCGATSGSVEPDDGERAVPRGGARRSGRPCATRLGGRSSGRGTMNPNPSRRSSPGGTRGEGRRTASRANIRAQLLHLSSRRKDPYLTSTARGTRGSTTRSFKTSPRAGSRSRPRTTCSRRRRGRRGARRKRGSTQGRRGCANSETTRGRTPLSPLPAPRELTSDNKASERIHIHSSIEFIHS